MSIFQERKFKLAKNRRGISEDKWYNYLEKCYPEWWNSIYNNKWRITIVYYYNNCYHNKDKTIFFEPILYPLYIDKNMTMHDIKNQFYIFLNNQKIAIRQCFGYDIAAYIIQYLPESNFNPLDNYFYVHKKIFNIDGSINFSRYYIKNDKTLIRLCGNLCQQDTNNLHLRIRRNPMSLSGYNFKKVYKY